MILPLPHLDLYMRKKNKYNSLLLKQTQLKPNCQDLKNSAEPLDWFLTALIPEKLYINTFSEISFPTLSNCRHNYMFAHAGSQNLVQL